MKNNLLRRLRGQRGATIIFVALAMVAILSFAALAVDLGYLYVVRNELQNAADSGALAGAQVLYLNDGTAVNPDAEEMAELYVHNNFSERESVTVESALRGHWSFSTRTFTANDSLEPVALWDVSTKELDENPDFINAVQVITRRTEEGVAPRQHFFARIFGAAPSQIRAVAVAYIGFAGTLEPHAVDMPIAVCKQALTYEGEFTCGIGRMLNSGSNATTHETAGWSNLTQPCSTANANELRDLVTTGTGNPLLLTFGAGIGATGGVADSVLSDLIDRWTGYKNFNPKQGDLFPTTPWPMTLPVIDCDKNNVSNCATVVGAVELNVLWINNANDTKSDWVPRKMYNPSTKTMWTCDLPETGESCWAKFVDTFNLKNTLAEEEAEYAQKSIYFLPDCTPHFPTGLTGGENFGILAKIPVLVR